MFVFVPCCKQYRGGGGGGGKLVPVVPMFCISVFFSFCSPPFGWLELLQLIVESDDLCFLALVAGSVAGRGYPTPHLPGFWFLERGE